MRSSLHIRTMPLCMSMTVGSFPAVNSVSTSVPFASTERAKMWLVKPSSGPSFAPVQSPSYQGISSKFSITRYTSCLL